ncbi:Glycosyl transferase, group 1 [Methanosarcina sp. MTP4]|uniref:glycosyltransferase family 4 protein n=1 Tax=Methanosarcina sp. MTP4 TaxID=1434100 RepID=UPI000615FF57|nr:glycosyltransferase family 4 protein [Methanosarcina sp. MTP4]AKB25967.1 Glycosyl transferase, group 1 [Methanosarcina sp. MTP4]
MKTTIKIIGITSGGLKGFSGVNGKLFNTIAKDCELIEVFDTKLYGFGKYYDAIYSFLRTPGYKKYIHPYNEILEGSVAYYRFRNNYYVSERTKIANKMLKENKKNYNLILQTGWLPAILQKNDVPRCIYTDYTTKLSEKELPQWSKFLSENDRKYWTDMETKSYENADIVFTFSNHTRQSMINDYEISEDKVVTVYSGTNVDYLPCIKKEYNKKIILFVGIDFERKGGYVLLDAFKKVKNEIKDARLIILGSNPKLNIEGVEVKGFVSYEEKIQYYNLASIFVMPSFGDPFPNAFIEAMSYRLPCIGSRVGGIPEIIEDAETGFLVEPYKSSQLAERIIYLLNNENLMKKMGDAGRKRVEERFTWDKVVKKMGSKFDKLM